MQPEEDKETHHNDGRRASYWERKAIVEQKILREPKYFVFSIYGGQKTPLKNPSSPLGNDTSGDTKPKEIVDIGPVIDELLKDPNYVSVSLDDVLNWAKSQKLDELVQYNTMSKELDVTLSKQMDSKLDIAGQESQRAERQKIINNARMEKNRLVAVMFRKKYESMIPDIVAKQEAEKKRIEELKQAEEEARRKEEEGQRKKAELLRKKQRGSARKRPGTGSNTGSKDTESPVEGNANQSASNVSEPGTAVDGLSVSQTEPNDDQLSQSVKTTGKEEEQNVIEKKEDKDTVFYVILRDYPNTVEEAKALIGERANFDAVVVVNGQARKGPPGMTPKERSLRDQQKQETAVNAGGKKSKAKATRPKSAAKKPSSAKGSRGKNVDTLRTPFHETLKQYVNLAVKENMASSARNVMFFEQTHFTYEYDEANAELEESDDMERELKRLAGEFTDNIAHVMKYRHAFEVITRYGVVDDRLVSDAPFEPVSNSHYRELMSRVPEHLASIPVVLNSVIEQVVRNSEESYESKAATDADVDTKGEEENLHHQNVNNALDVVVGEFTKPPKRDAVTGEERTSATANLTVEDDGSIALVNAEPSVTLINHGDRIMKREIEATEITTGVTTADVEKEMIKLMPVLSAISEGNEQTEKPETKENETAEQNPISEEQEEQETADTVFNVPPITNEKERSARKTELFHFLSMDHLQPQKEYRMTMEQMEKELTICRFEDILQSNGINASLDDRLFCEDYTKNSLMQVLSELTLFHDYDIFSEYYDLEDSALVAFCKSIPQSRFEQRPWVNRFGIPPTFAEWVEPEHVKNAQKRKKAFEDTYNETHRSLRKEGTEKSVEEDVSEPPHEGALATTSPTKEEEGGGERGDESEALQVQDVEDENRDVNSSLQTTHKQKWHEMRLSQSQNERYVMEGPESDVYHDTTLFYPSDGAIIELESLTQVDNDIRCSVHKDGAQFSIRRRRRNIDNDQTIVSREYTFSITFEDSIHAVVSHEEIKARGPSKEEREKRRQAAEEETKKREEEERQRQMEEEEAKKKKRPGSTKGRGGTVVKSEREPPQQDTVLLADKDQNLDYGSDADDDEEEEEEADYGNPENKRVEVCLACSNGLYLRMVSDGVLYQSFVDNHTELPSSNFSGFNVETKQHQNDGLSGSPDDEFVPVWSHEKNAVVNLRVREVVRAHMPNGDIVRKFNERKVIQIMHANGNTSTRSKSKYWLIVSDDGSRHIVTPSADRFDIESVMTAVNVDPETLAEVHSREDRVMVVKYPDSQSMMVQHVDGTRFWQSMRRIEGKREATAEFTKVLLTEKHGFATVEITDFGGEKSEMHTDVTEIGARIHFDSAERHVSLLKDGHRAIIDFDTKYIDVEPSSLAFQKSPSEKYPYGVYSFNYVTGNFKTVDIDGHGYVIATNTGESLLRYANVLAPASSKELREDEFFPREDSNDRQEYGLPPVLIEGTAPEGDGNQNVHPPRLFEIRRKDGSGREYFGEDRVLPLLHAASAPNSNTTLTEDSEDRASTSLSFLTKCERTPSLVRPLLPIPKSVLPLPNEALLKRRRIEKTRPTLTYHRKITQFIKLSSEDRQHIRDGIGDWKKWLSQRERQFENAPNQSEPTSILDTRTEQEIQEAEEMKERASDLMEKLQINNSEGGTSSVNDQEEMQDEGGDLDSGDSEGSSESDEDDVIYHGKESTSSSQAADELHKVEEQEEEEEEEENDGTNSTETDTERQTEPLLHSEYERQNRLNKILATERKLLEPINAKGRGMRYWEKSEQGRQFLERQQSRESSGHNPMRRSDSRRSSISISIRSDKDSQNGRTQSIDGTTNEGHESIRTEQKSPALERDVINANDIENMAPSEVATKSMENTMNTTPRHDPLHVRSTRKEEARSEVNIQYKLREHDTRRRVKTSSMMLTKQKYADADSLGTSAYSRTKNLNSIPHVSEPDMPKISVYPPGVDFGMLREGDVYQATVLVTNFGHIPGRFVVKYHNHVNREMRVLYKKGPIAPGMSVKVDLQVFAEEIRSFQHELTITTEDHNITLPVRGNIISSEQFEKDEIVLSKRIKVVTDMRLPRAR